MTNLIRLIRDQLRVLSNSNTLGGTVLDKLMVVRLNVEEARGGEVDKKYHVNSVRRQDFTLPTLSEIW